MAEEKIKQDTKEEKVAEIKETATEKRKSKDEKKIVKKDEAVAVGRNLHLSKKHGIYLCKFIKNKKIDNAIKNLEGVINLKNAVGFRGEVPHRKGSMMSGRYPVNGAKLFIPLLKGLKGNALVNGLDLDRTVVYYASANWGFRPAKRKGGRVKRTNVLLKAKEIGGIK